MSKYVDLAGQIDRSITYYRDVAEAVEKTLEFLDNHPDQVPGRTITESDFDYAYELHKGVDGDAHYEGLLRTLGISIIPDPEPTNAENLARLIRESGIFVGDFEDEHIALANSLDEDGVKAPDHD